MLEEVEHEEGSERECPGMLPGELPCNQPATVHCVQCDKWFCDVHAEDEERHNCIRSMNLNR
jgi:hypothetical protein